MSCARPVPQRRRNDEQPFSYWKWQWWNVPVVFVGWPMHGWAFGDVTDANHDERGHPMTPPDPLVRYRWTYDGLYESDDPTVPRWYHTEPVDALIAEHADLVASLWALVDEIQAQGAQCDTFHATMGVGYKQSAERLAARLPPRPTGEPT